MGDDSYDKLIPKVYDDALKGSVRKVGKVLQEAVRVSRRLVSDLICSVDNVYDWTGTKSPNSLQKKKCNQKPWRHQVLKWLFG